MIHVLVVDDDFMVARLHSSVVSRQPGFEVVGAARNGAEALAAVRSLRPDLVLLDIHLPDMSGLEVLRRFRESAADYPVDVIVISAARDLDSLRTALRGGVFQYLVKPFEIESLRSRLKEYAEHRAELQRLTDVDQAEVDRVFRAQGSRGAVAAPKGISPETTDLVVQALGDAPDDGMSASDCAEVTGLSRSSTRRYLEHLVTIGRAEMRPRYGVAGRPERRYRLVRR
ncbi:response regulator of citrate/malate metabolism [Kribbella antiqua]|uniref:Transcriptional regulatory protein n=1 Tax=Kribbella antiqua TaxID=2512217 RepID=A0A4R2IKP9_9ACTN|nr:response regulator [Kribbella antiqua]TCO45012.1 response regulator of citrate/malate metabolism [Kribbella antiqua]